VKKLFLFSLAIAVPIALLVLAGPLRRPAIAAYQIVRGRRTVAERVAQYGPAARLRLAPCCERAGLAYPPGRVVLVGFKDTKQLEVWASAVDGPYVYLKTYLILGASGVLGPKLKEGDKQVPEGLYRIESLNPNSLYHLALRVNYPNAFDRARGAEDGRTDLGCDIMIHGGRLSIGCLAVGDEAAEELFVLAAETGVENMSLILSPVDFRKGELPADTPEAPGWTKELYESIKEALRPLTPRRGEQGKEQK
jgi:hypothetical protein